MVPNGKQPIVLPDSMVADATALIVPSPPPATMISASLRAACRARSTILAPVRANEMRASIPFATKISRIRCCASFLSSVPELALMITSIFTCLMVVQICTKNVALDSGPGGYTGRRIPYFQHSGFILRDEQLVTTLIRGFSNFRLLINNDPRTHTKLHEASLVLISVGSWIVTSLLIWTLPGTWRSSSIRRAFR